MAGVVGEVAANIFGRTDAATIAYAHKLGLAMQLTNIIRDVGDDARRGRIYLPMDELKRFDVKANEMLKRETPWGYSERFSALMSFRPSARSARSKRRSRCCLKRTAVTAAGADDGADLPHAAAGDSRRRLPGAAPAMALTPLRKVWIAMRTQWRGAERQVAGRRRRGLGRLGCRRARRRGGHQVTLFEMAPTPAAARAA